MWWHHKVLKAWWRDSLQLFILHESFATALGILNPRKEAPSVIALDEDSPLVLAPQSPKPPMTFAFADLYLVCIEISWAMSECALRRIDCAHSTPDSNAKWSECLFLKATRSPNDLVPHSEINGKRRSSTQTFQNFLSVFGGWNKDISVIANRNVLFLLILQHWFLHTLREAVAWSHWGICNVRKFCGCRSSMPHQVCLRRWKLQSQHLRIILTWSQYQRFARRCYGLERTYTYLTVHCWVGLVVHGSFNGGQYVEWVWLVWVWFW